MSCRDAMPARRVPHPPRIWRHPIRCHQIDRRPFQRRQNPRRVQSEIAKTHAAVHRSAGCLRCARDRRAGPRPGIRRLPRGHPLGDRPLDHGRRRDGGIRRHGRQHDPHQQRRRTRGRALLHGLLPHQRRSVPPTADRLLLQRRPGIGLLLVAHGDHGTSAGRHARNRSAGRASVSAGGQRLHPSRHRRHRDDRPDRHRVQPHPGRHPRFRLLGHRRGRRFAGAVRAAFSERVRPLELAPLPPRRELRDDAVGGAGGPPAALQHRPERDRAGVFGAPVQHDPVRSGRRPAVHREPAVVRDYGPVPRRAARRLPARPGSLHGRGRRVVAHRLCDRAARRAGRSTTPPAPA